MMMRKVRRLRARRIWKRKKSKQEYYVQSNFDHHSFLFFFIAYLRFFRIFMCISFFLFFLVFFIFSAKREAGLANFCFFVFVSLLQRVRKCVKKDGVFSISMENRKRNFISPKAGESVGARVKCGGRGKSIFTFFFYRYKYTSIYTARFLFQFSR